MKSAPINVGKTFNGSAKYSYLGQRNERSAVQGKNVIWKVMRLRIQDYICQQINCLLKLKMLQFVMKISIYMAPTCFGPSWTIIREHMMEPC